MELSSSDRGVLVIGGAGFIGTAVCARLVTEGFKAHVIGRSPPRHALSGVDYHLGDLADRKLVLSLLGTCPTVIHAASATTPGSSSRTPSLEVHLNLEPTLSFLEIAREQAPRRMVFLSSGGTLYAEAAGRADESLPPTARSYHGAGKIALEAFLRAFGWETGCRLVTLRPSNVYGPGQEMRRGFGFVRVALECALRGEALELWGDAGAVRDFLYIDDLVDAIVAALRVPDLEGTFNVASGTGYALSEVVRIVRETSGRPLETFSRPGRKCDLHTVCLDAARIAAVLGWRPTVGLEEGVARTWNWLRAGHE